jgi:hypothetical protein
VSAVGNDNVTEPVAPDTVTWPAVPVSDVTPEFVMTPPEIEMPVPAVTSDGTPELLVPSSALLLVEKTTSGHDPAALRCCMRMSPVAPEANEDVASIKAARMVDFNAFMW